MAEAAVEPIGWERALVAAEKVKERHEPSMPPESLTR